MEKHCTPSAEKIIQFNESAIQGHLSEMVRQSVETTLNQMIEAEADRSCHAEKYQRSEARKDTRAGFYQRQTAQGGRGHAEYAQAAPADL